jgi:hypothetical protein
MGNLSKAIKFNIISILLPTGITETSKKINLFLLDSTGCDLGLQR